MRFIFYILAFTFLIVGINKNVTAQIESYRVGYFTEQLQLTPEEGQKFWPVYNQYRGELKSLRQTYRLDGDDDSQLADKKIEFEQKKLDLVKKYRPQFEQAIGAQKYGLLLSAEEKYKQELLKRIQDNKGGKGAK